MSSSVIGSSSSTGAWKHENKTTTRPDSITAVPVFARATPSRGTGSPSMIGPRLLQRRQRGIELGQAALVVLLLVVGDRRVVVALGGVLLGAGGRLRPGGLDHLQLVGTGRRRGGGADRQRGNADQAECGKGTEGDAERLPCDRHAKFPIGHGPSIGHLRRPTRTP